MSDKLTFGRDINEFLRSRGAPRTETADADNGNGYGIRLLSAKPSGDERVILAISVSNPSGSEETEMVLLTEHFREMGLSVGILDAETMPELEYWSEVARAYFSACSSFAYTPSSLSTLRKKLIQKGFPKDVASDAIASVKSRGFVDEGQIALRRAQLCVDKKWGRSRVLMKLREEGFDEDSLGEARKFLATVNFAENCAALIKRKFGNIPDDRHERELMCASLSRMGYSATEIRAAQEIVKKQF
ncbi:MAG: RecX family transcriptional regulator [Clostridia bacterium]|nr:RecX family transcriptional regulator [Clostridia bacterium]